MHDGWRRASLKRRRTRDAPTPAYISTKSEPLANRNGTPASPAIDRARSVLPVPRGRPGGCLGDASADCHKAIRLAQEIDDFFDFVFGLVDARHVFERDDAIALLGDTRAARDGRNAPGRGPIDSEREERQKRCDRRRRAPTERSGRGGGNHLDANLAPVEIGDKRRVGREELRRRHVCATAVTQHDVDGMVRKGDSGDLSRVDGFEKIRESQRRGRDSAGGDERASRHHEEDGGGD